jgi:hypothetical protein
MGPKPITLAVAPGDDASPARQHRDCPSTQINHCAVVVVLLISLRLSPSLSHSTLDLIPPSLFTIVILSFCLLCSLTHRTVYSVKDWKQEFGLAPITHTQRSAETPGQPLESTPRLALRHHIPVSAAFRATPRSLPTHCTKFPYQPPFLQTVEYCWLQITGHPQVRPFFHSINVNCAWRLILISF